MLLKKAFVQLECLKLTRFLKELESLTEDENGFEEDDVEEYYDDSDDEEYFIDKILGKECTSTSTAVAFSILAVYF